MEILGNEGLYEYANDIDNGKLEWSLDSGALSVTLVKGDGSVIDKDDYDFCDYCSLAVDVAFDLHAQDIDTGAYLGEIRFVIHNYEDGLFNTETIDLNSLWGGEEDHSTADNIKFTIYRQSEGSVLEDPISNIDDFYSTSFSYDESFFLIGDDLHTLSELEELYRSAITATVTDNTPYPDLICEESSMSIFLDLDVEYSLEEGLPLGLSINTKYNPYVSFGGSSVVFFEAYYGDYDSSLVKITAHKVAVHVPQPEIVGDDLTVDLEVISPASFKLGNHEFFELGYVPSGTGSADLTISGGEAPYTYSVRLWDYAYFTDEELDGHTNAVSDDGVVELRNVVGTSNTSDADYYNYYNTTYRISVTDANGCTFYKYFNIPYRYEERPSLSSTKLVNEIYLDSYTDGLSNGSVSVTANTEAPAVLEFKKESDSEWKTLHTFQLGNEDEVSFTEEGLDAGTYEFRLSLTAEEDQGYSISSQVEVIKAEPSNSCQLLIEYIMNEQIAKLQERLDAVEARADQAGRIVESNNFALGEGTLENADSTTDYNFAFGRNTLHNLEGGDKNISIGNRSQYNNVTGNDNISIGNGALDNVVDGEGNIAIGKNAGNWEGNSSNKLSIGSGAPLIGGDFETREITLDGKTLSFLTTGTGIQFVSWDQK